MKWNFNCLSAASDPGAHLLGLERSAMAWLDWCQALSALWRLCPKLWGWLRFPLLLLLQCSRCSGWSAYAKLYSSVVAAAAPAALTTQWLSLLSHPHPPRHHHHRLHLRQGHHISWRCCLPLAACCLLLAACRLLFAACGKRWNAAATLWCGQDQSRRLFT